MKWLDATDPGFESTLDALLRAREDPATDAALDERVRQILGAVRIQGDAALLSLTRELDRWDAARAEDLEVSAAERSRALDGVGTAVAADLRLAAERIRVFHARQREESWAFETEEGIRLAQRTVPLRAVGVYVPGGTAAYPSSVLMNVVPAKVAGVETIVMVTPAPGGVVAPAVLAAAEIAGVDRVFRIGGAQAVAALAFGTATVPRVDKIVGPGNAWVAAAKRQVFGTVAIDMIAGPSEVCVVATTDGGASPADLAADLLSQAEHDPRAMVCLVTPERALAEAVAAELDRQVERLPRRDIARAALDGYGVMVVTRDVAHALAVAERIAPEHLELVIPDALGAAENVRNAGAVFCGPHTPEAVGDYIAGPNHVLPTSGTARFSSPLGVHDFTRRLNVLRFTRAGLAALGPATIRLAEVEGLAGHAESVRRRLE